MNVFYQRFVIMLKDWINFKKIAPKKEISGKSERSTKSSNTRRHVARTQLQKYENS